MGDIAKKLMPIFLAESKERLVVLDRFAVSEATGTSAFEELKSAFRAAHTLKGTAGLVKLSTTRAIAGQIEEVLTALLKARRTPSANLKATLQKTIAQLQQQVELAASGQPEVEEAAEQVATLLSPFRRPSSEKRSATLNEPTGVAPPPAGTATSLTTDLLDLTKVLAPTDPATTAERVVVNVCCQFQNSGKTFSIPMADMVEIGSVTTVIPLPLAPGYIRGLLNLRSQVMPVIDLAPLYDQPLRPLTHRHLVIAETAGEKLAFLTDDIPSLTPAFAGTTLNLSEFVQQHGIRGN